MKKSEGLFVYLCPMCFWAFDPFFKKYNDVHDWSNNTIPNNMHLVEICFPCMFPTSFDAKYPVLKAATLVVENSKPFENCDVISKSISYSML